MYILRPNETLESLKDKVAKVAGRPAFITAGQVSREKDCRFKGPGDKTYRVYQNWETFFTTLHDKGRCVGQNFEDLRLFDLTESPFIYITVPCFDKDTRNPKVADECGYFNCFQKTRLEPLGPTYVRIPVPKGQEHCIPTELLPYLRDDQRGSRLGQTYRGLKFVLSAIIERPLVRRDTWSVDFEGNSGGHKMHSLIPPGQYSGEPHTILFPFNHAGIAETEVGSCIVCCGESGDHIHFVSMANGSGTAYPTNFICRKCARESFDQWLRIADQM